MGGRSRRGTVGERTPDPLRFGDTSNAGSSTGWTDQKHMLYISSLEESFVITQLYDGEINSKGMSPPSVWSHRTSYGNSRYTKVDQGYSRMVEADGAESRVSTSCYGDQKDRTTYHINDDASTTEPRHEKISYHATRKKSGGPHASHFQCHGHFFPRTELSDQNFVDDEAGVSGEQSRGLGKKSLKHI